VPADIDPAHTLLDAGARRTGIDWSGALDGHRMRTFARSGECRADRRTWIRVGQDDLQFDRAANFLAHLVDFPEACS
jgi:hypothetical protein